MLGLGLGLGLGSTPHDEGHDGRLGLGVKVSVSVRVRVRVRVRVYLMMKGRMVASSTTISVATTPRYDTQDRCSIFRKDSGNTNTPKENAIT